MSELERLRAENERLRAAIHAALNATDSIGEQLIWDSAEAWEILDAARTWLSTQPTEPVSMCAKCDREATVIIEDRGHEWNACDAHAPFWATPQPSDPGPIVWKPPLTQAESDAYWAAISDDPEPGEPESPCPMCHDTGWQDGYLCPLHNGERGPYVV